MNARKEPTMRTLAHKRVRGTVLLAAALTVVAALTLPAAAPSAPTVQSIDLCAKAGTTTLPGNVTVPIWGFATKPAGVPCSDTSVVPTLPGPALDVGAGDTVTLNVTNALDAGHTISLEAPGLDFAAGPTDAVPGATVSRTFTASAPGTYVYESSGGAGRHEAMGLYGVLIVRPSTAGRAYDTAASAFDVDRTVVLSEIDPALNSSLNPDAFAMADWSPSYWLINGQPYPGTATIDAQAGQRVLLRYVNAGLEHVTLTMLGLDARMVAKDAYPLQNPFDAVAQTFPAGATADGIVTIPSSAGTGDRFPVYDRGLHLTNGAFGDPAHAPGGMLTFIRVTGP
jgi:FtsP/CotA-like multicopper oxidase with cupredoxin domain